MRLEWQAMFEESHPAFAGHFPGRPVLPGVLLLDGVVRRVESAVAGENAGGASPASGCEIVTAKFLRPAGPGETLAFTCEWDAAGSGRFHVEGGSGRVAEGRLTLGPGARADRAA